MPPRIASAPLRLPLMSANGADARLETGVAIRYKEKSRLTLHGPVTGRTYDFSATAPVQQIDGRDASELLGLRFLTRA